MLAAALILGTAIQDSRPSAPAAAKWVAKDEATRESVAQLREILNRSVRGEAQFDARRADAQAWVAKLGKKELGDGGFLKALAECTAAAADAERAPSQDALRRIVDANGGYPVEGFEKPAASALLFLGTRYADAGEWEKCREYLPLLKRHYPDHAAIYWLLGRRGRDHGTDGGRKFLHEVIVPELLADPALDDGDRVAELRRLWEVDYTGPRSFSHVEGPGLDGATVSTASYRGRVLLVDYWATWYKPCLAEAPNVVEAWKRFGPRGFAVVGVCIDDEGQRAKVVETVKRIGMLWPQIVDGKGSFSPLATVNKVTAIPATFLIDKKGRVRWTGLDGEALLARVEELLNEAE